MIIAVIGESHARPHIAKLAEEVGRELARRKIDLVCGGMGGVIEAACRGAKAEGGTTIAILAGSDPLQSNDYIDIPILTGLGYARNVIVVKTGMAVIAVGGAYGTLSEIGHALAEDIPVIGLQTWTLTRSGEDPDTSIIIVSDPDAAVHKAIRAAEDRLQALERRHLDSG
jgi:uncharacterized protein (TIGR00725 family)